MVVTAVNGRQVRWETPTEAAQLLKNAKIGADITVTVEVFTARLQRKSKSDPWGLSIKKARGQSCGVVIWKLEGKFSSTILERGMRIIQINGKSCPKQAKDAYDLLKKSKYDLEIVAVDIDHVDLDQYWQDLPETPIKPPGVTACAFDDQISAVIKSLSLCGAAYRIEEDPGTKDASLDSLRQMKPLAEIKKSALVNEYRANQRRVVELSDTKRIEIVSDFQDTVTKEIEIVSDLEDTSSDTSSETSVSKNKDTLSKKKQMRKTVINHILFFKRAKARREMPSYFQKVKHKY
jgi:sulfur carrier protein ThiS